MKEQNEKDIKKIVEFVYDCLKKQGVLTKDKEIADFVVELQKRVSNMNFGVKQGVVVIGYSGTSNEVECHKIVKRITEITDKEAMYISDLPAGVLLNDVRFEKAITDLLGGNKVAVAKIVNGYDISNGGWKNAVRLEGGYVDMVKEY